MAVTRIQITISIPPSLVAGVDKLAAESGTSRSSVMTQAIREHLEGPGQFVAAMGNPTIRQAFAQAFGRPEVLKGLASAMAADAQPEQLRLFEDSIKAVMGAGSGQRTGAREYRSPGQPVSGGDSKRSTVRAGGGIHRTKPTGAGGRTKRGDQRGTKKGTSHP